MEQLIDEPLFEEAKDHMIGTLPGCNGIGTLGEKTVHSVLKYYYAPNELYHEVKIGKFVADICVDGEIYEVQTRHFYAMRRKLDFFLTRREVTIIHPIIYSSTIRWIDPETGEMSSPKKSSRRGKIYQVLTELYSIRALLSNPKLHFIFPFITTEEYRLLDGYGPDKKKRATKCDKLPQKLLKEIRIQDESDYAIFLPEELPDTFTSADYAKCAKVSRSLASTALLILTDVHMVERIGKSGNSILYRVRV